MIKFKTAKFRMDENQKLRHKTSQFFDLFSGHDLIDSYGATIDINDQIDFMPSCKQVINNFYRIRRAVLISIITTIHKQFLITPFGLSIENFINTINTFYPNSIQTHFGFNTTQELTSQVQYYPRQFRFHQNNCHNKTQISISQNSIFEKAYTGHNLTNTKLQKPIDHIKYFRHNNQQGLTLEDLLTEFLYNKQYQPDSIYPCKETIFETVSLPDQCTFLVETTKQGSLHIFPTDPQKNLPQDAKFRNKINF